MVVVVTGQSIYNLKVKKDAPIFPSLPTANLSCYFPIDPTGIKFCPPASGWLYNIALSFFSKPATGVRLKVLIICTRQVINTLGTACALAACLAVVTLLQILCKFANRIISNSYRYFI